MSFELHGKQIRLDGRRIGWMTRLANGEKVFVSPRKRSIHYFRIFKGFGLSKAALEFLQRNLFTRVILKTSKRESLMSRLDDWFSKGIPYHKKPDFEPQLVLPEQYMTKRMVTLSELMS